MCIHMYFQKIIQTFPVEFFAITGRLNRIIGCEERCLSPMQA